MCVVNLPDGPHWGLRLLLSNQTGDSKERKILTQPQRTRSVTCAVLQCSYILTWSRHKLTAVLIRDRWAEGSRQKRQQVCLCPVTAARREDERLRGLWAGGDQPSFRKYQDPCIDCVLCSHWRHLPVRLQHLHHQLSHELHPELHQWDLHGALGPKLGHPSGDPAVDFDCVILLSGRVGRRSARGAHGCPLRKEEVSAPEQRLPVCWSRARADQQGGEVIRDDHHRPVPGGDELGCEHEHPADVFWGERP